MTFSAYMNPGQILNACFGLPFHSNMDVSQLRDDPKNEIGYMKNLCA